MAKEVLIVIGRDAGATVVQLSELTELDTSTISRRYDTAKEKLGTDSKLSYAKDLAAKKYYERIAESQA